MTPFSRLRAGILLFLPVFAHIFVTPTFAQYPSRPPAEPSGGPKGPNGWEKLKDIGPRHDAVVTLGDGTLRAGWILGVGDASISMQSAGRTFELAASDIATVRVKRSDRTLLYSVIGYLVTGTVATVIAYNDDDHNAYYHENRKLKDLVVVFGVGGIPGGLIGAAIGHRRSGDVEFVP